MIPLTELVTSEEKLSGFLCFFPSSSLCVHKVKYISLQSAFSKDGDRLIAVVYINTTQWFRGRINPVFNPRRLTVSGLLVVNSGQSWIWVFVPPESSVFYIYIL